MEALITNFNHGNGPYIKTITLCIAVNEELKKRGHSPLPIIVPHIYGDLQKKILSEEFADILKDNPEALLLDDFSGELLESLLFKTGHYQRNLELLLENQPKQEVRLRDYLQGTLTVKTLSGKEIKIPGEGIQFEIANNPKFATGYRKSFMTTEGFFSQVLYETAEESALGFDPKVLQEVRYKIANKIEEDKSLHLMSEPSIFSYNISRKRWRNEIFTPPFTHLPEKNSEDVEEGMYVMISGIAGLRPLFDQARDFGMKLYCPSSVKDLNGADNTRHPSFVTNPNIRYQFARTGWSTVWWSHMSETPLITLPYQHGDDPEIFFNEKTVTRLGIATLYDPGKDNPKEVLERADLLSPHIKGVNERLLSVYGTIDGINYMAKVIAASLEGKSLDSYKLVEPAFNE